MQTHNFEIDTGRYARCIEISKRVRWDIDDDVIRGREFDPAEKFLPDTLSRVQELGFLTEGEKRTLSQIQGRTYANMFGLVERYIGAKIMEVSRDHLLGNQVALESLVRFTDEEIKHQELFRRIDAMCADVMPEGYRFVPDPDEVAAVVLAKSTWSVLALTNHIELFTQAHYKQSIEPDSNVSKLYKDVFLYHWKEESQHAIVDELEWCREDARLTVFERDQGVEDLIALVIAVDGILQVQSTADAEYFANMSERQIDPEETGQIRDGLLRAYRWQYIVSGATHERFQQVLGGLINQKQGQRITDALAPLIQAVR